jgi:hypothetical protein
MAYLFNMPHRTQRVFCRIEQIGLYFTIAKFVDVADFWPLWQSSPQKRPFCELAVLLYNIVY